MKNGERDELKKVLKERINENGELFSKTELQFIEKNKSIVKKIYLLGLIDAREIYYE